MRKEDVTIGKTCYLLFLDGKLVQDEISSLYVHAGFINCALTKTKNVNSACYFYFKDGEQASGAHEYYYQKTNSFKAFLNKQEAAEEQRRTIIQHVQRLKLNVQRSFGDLQEYRKKYYEVLNSTDVKEWVQNFHRENEW